MAIQHNNRVPIIVAKHRCKTSNSGITPSFPFATIQHIKTVAAEPPHATFEDRHNLIFI